MCSVRLRAPDWRLKGRGFESWQEKFLLQGQPSVPTFIFWTHKGCRWVLVSGWLLGCELEGDDDEHFYTAIFCMLEQTHCTFVACDSSSLWLTFFHIHLFNIYAWLLHRQCHEKLPLSRHDLCTPYNHAPCHVTSRKATYMGRMHVQL